MLSLRAVCALTALFSAVHQASATCESYGIDFVGGGSYFINSNSDDYFTAVSEFSGCEDDVASNSIVDPNGDRTDCTSTPLTPDYTPETMNWYVQSFHNGIAVLNPYAAPAGQRMTCTLETGPSSF